MASLIVLVAKMRSIVVSDWLYIRLIILFDVCFNNFFIDCPKTAFKCANNKCISKEWECDGEDDCGDDSDESESCANRTCDITQFRCKFGRCIPLTYVCGFILFFHNIFESIFFRWKCDGEADCHEHDDELACYQANSTYCDENHFRCNNNRCISRKFCIFTFSFIYYLF